jgi:hypothetical protein
MTIFFLILFAIFFIAMCWHITLVREAYLDFQFLLEQVRDLGLDELEWGYIWKYEDKHPRILHNFFRKNSISFYNTALDVGLRVGWASCMESACWRILVIEQRCPKCGQMCSQKCNNTDDFIWFAKEEDHKHVCTTRCRKMVAEAVQSHGHSVHGKHTGN